MARQHPNLVETEYYHVPTLDGIEAATQSYKKGAFVVWSSGKIAEASANPRDIAGLALAAASGTTNNATIFADLLPGVKLEMSLDKAADLGNRALAQTDVGAAYGVTKDSNGVWYVDIDKVTAGTNTAVRVVKLIDPIGAKTSDTPTDTNSGGNRVWVRLLTEASAYQTAAS